METQTQTTKKGLLSSLLGPVSVSTDVGVSQNTLLQAGSAVFVTACLVILAYFTFKKLF